MTNNIKEWRLAFLLSPREFARLIGIYPDYVPRLESGERPLNDIWISAIAKALGVPRAAIADPHAEIALIAASVPRPALRRPAVCPIGARFAILSLVAKWGGLRIVNALSEDEIADAVQSFISYVDDRAPDMPGGPSGETRINRLSQGLQITALTILQSRADDLPPDFEETLATALPAAVQLLEAYSQVDETTWLPGT